MDPRRGFNEPRRFVDACKQFQNIYFSFITFIFCVLFSVLKMVYVLHGEEKLNATPVY